MKIAENLGNFLKNDIIEVFFFDTRVRVCHVF